MLLLTVPYEQTLVIHQLRSTFNRPKLVFESFPNSVSLVLTTRPLEAFLYVAAQKANILTRAFKLH